MKRSRLSLTSPDSPDSPPSDQSPTPSLGYLHSAMPQSPAQLERDEELPQADYYSTLPRSQGLSVGVTPAESESELALAAEYREWPFQEFLKRVTVNGQTTFNLKFSLPCISEHLKPPSYSKHFGASSSNSFAEDAQLVTSRSTGSGKPVQFKRSSPLASAPSKCSRYPAKDKDNKE